MKRITPKQLITTLFAFYILVITLSPCVDTELNCCSTPGIEAGSAATGSQADHHDCCSPFCTCSCCNVAMEAAVTFVFMAASFVPHQLMFSFLSRFNSSFSFSIWEPPKA